MIPRGYLLDGSRDATIMASYRILCIYSLCETGLLYSMSIVILT